MSWDFSVDPYRIEHTQSSPQQHRWEQHCWAHRTLQERKPTKKNIKIKNQKQYRAKQAHFAAGQPGVVQSSTSSRQHPPGAAAGFGKRPAEPGAARRRLSGSPAGEARGEAAEAGAPLAPRPCSPLCPPPIYPQQEGNGLPGSGAGTGHTGLWVCREFLPPLLGKADFKALPASDFHYEKI